MNLSASSSLIQHASCVQCEVRVKPSVELLRRELELPSDVLSLPVFLTVGEFESPLAMFVSPSIRAWISLHNVGFEASELSRYDILNLLVDVNSVNVTLLEKTFFDYKTLTAVF